MALRTHTFRLGRYSIELASSPIDGLCEVPGAPEPLYMMVQDSPDLNGLNTALHEAMHAEGIPDKYIDGGDNSPDRIAKFLWRWLHEVELIK